MEEWHKHGQSATVGIPVKGSIKVAQARLLKYVTGPDPEHTNPALAATDKAKTIDHHVWHPSLLPGPLARLSPLMVVTTMASLLLLKLPKLRLMVQPLNKISMVSFLIA